MKRTLMMSAATIFLLASSASWAAGPNDGPKYPTVTSNKHYTDQRIMDHNNGAPRYAVTSNPSKQYTDQRIMDHNNGAPRYPVTAAGSQASRTAAVTRGARVVHRSNRAAPVMAHVNSVRAHHG
jgi:hypothetical protein